MIGSERAAAVVESARAMLDVCGSLALEPHDEVAELLARTAELARIVDAQRVLLAAAVVERSTGPADGSLCRRLGHRSAKEALASAFGLRGRQAAELLTMAARTTAAVGISGGSVPIRYPRGAAALGRGELSLPQAQAQAGWCCAQGAPGCIYGPEGAGRLPRRRRRLRRRRARVGRPRGVE